jgi:IS30 family transposase
MGINWLTFDEREKIENLLNRQYSYQKIADEIGRSLRCIKYEIKRGGGRDNYKAVNVATRFMKRFTDEELTLPLFPEYKACHSTLVAATKEEKLYERLTLDERKVIHKLINEGISLSQIAIKLKRGKNTVIHEVRINGGRHLYDAIQAQKASDKRLVDKANKTAATCDSLHAEKKEKENTRIANIEMQIEILIDVVKELRNTHR